MQAVYHACYLDHRVRFPASLTADVLTSAIAHEHTIVAHNLTQIVSVFKEATSHSSAAACLDHLTTIDAATRVVLFIDMPSQDPELNHVQKNALHGPTFLQRIHKVSSVPKRLYPVALVDDEEAEMATYIDLGAIDVIHRSIQEPRIRGILVQLYRDTCRILPHGANRAGWIGGSLRTSTGGDDERLIESLFNVMIFDESSYPDQLAVTPMLLSREREPYLRSIIGDWDFPANKLTDDELTQCAYYIFQHSFTMPEVQHLVLSPGGLQHFISVLRASYHSQNPYHNFRHVVDVLQATFSFLLSMKALPPYITSTLSQQEGIAASPVSRIFDPVDALALLVAAIGHDVGHPGVTNAFLIATRSPLARMYNDRSVLESFHCAAFNQLLARYWPTLQEKNIKNIIVDAVLATDMALHFDYMRRLDSIVRDGAVLVGDDDKENALRKRLLCSTLIKCADVSNVARRLDISIYWGTVLQEEFRKMSDLEAQVGLTTSLPAQPANATRQPAKVLSLDEKEAVALAKSQLFFINAFAGPLFDAIALVVPELQYTADHVSENKQAWEQRLADLS
ncbi:hypothetical protein POJ06DRAFT_97780 [Lipomyces tetrasporus]|uniref:Phosphodiesterase n=1 Tax=Lipomyces tetrasporus TaxID=54092 RepID=A0AAD7VUQ1_9ASCO|nr:uncharacterized protein POJ06DRAFT_97780 [Lipomyces tetrasporus]KAJ8101500.1 hypothetical protein POJ06DRAFT_97780 [Lipomyces tetrasporus]